jgi:hypothetical protein
VYSTDGDTADSPVVFSPVDNPCDGAAGMENDTRCEFSFDKTLL